MKIIKKLLILALLILLGLSGYVGYKGYRIYREALDQTGLEQMVGNVRSKANYTKFQDLPEQYVNAVVAVEDHRFYKHPGIDLLAMGRAVVNDLKAGAFVEGGSTITQQLAKNLYFNQEKELERKVAEVFMAFAIEDQYSKEEILELYVNSIYFGNGYYSVYDAAMGYFQSTPGELTEDECTMLAGIPNAPSVYNPDNMELARKRQTQVIKSMVKYGYLTEEEGVQAQLFRARTG